METAVRPKIRRNGARNLSPAASSGSSARSSWESWNNRSRRSFRNLDDAASLRTWDTNSVITNAVTVKANSAKTSSGLYIRNENKGSVKKKSKQPADRAAMIAAETKLPVSDCSTTSNIYTEMAEAESRC